jgi:hypothetical protein
MRCQKSKRVCPGYRDFFELNHRAEMKATRKTMPRVVDKLAFSFPNGHELIEQRSTSWISSSRDRLQSQSSYPLERRNQARELIPTTRLALTRHLSIPVDQQASCYFLSNFVLGPGNSLSSRYLDFLVPLLKNSHANSALNLTFSAVSCAALGFRQNNRNLLPQIDAHYLKALKAINIALKDPVLMKDDATLAAIVLLSNFEVSQPQLIRESILFLTELQQIVTTAETNKGWAKHVDGAVALVKVRGKGQFTSPEASELFIAVRSHMVNQNLFTIISELLLTCTSMYNV